jgi:hypothetical protein
MKGKKKIRVKRHKRKKKKGGYSIIKSHLRLIKPRKLRQVVREAYIRELDIMRQRILNDGFISQHFFHNIPLDFFVVLLKKYGFEEVKGSDFTVRDYEMKRKSYSLRRKIDNAIIHILLRKTKTGQKWIAVHRDYITRGLHRGSPLTYEQRKYLDDILFHKMSEVLPPIIKEKIPA